MYLKDEVFVCESCGNEVKIMEDDDGTTPPTCCDDLMALKEGCISLKKGEKILNLNS